VSPRPCPRPRRGWPRRSLSPWPRSQRARALRSWRRHTAVWRNAGSSSTRTIARRRLRARSRRRGARRVPTKSKSCRHGAGPRVLGQQRLGRPAPVLRPAGSRRCSTTAPSAPRPPRDSAGDQARGHSPTRSSPLSQAPWRLGAPTVGHASTSRVAFSWRRTHGTRASDRPQPGSTATKGTPEPHVGCASCKPRSFWPPPALSKSLSASWPCGWA